VNTPASVGDVAGAPTDPETLRHRIAYTRDELAETVEALAAKTDVKARAAQAAGGAAGTVTGELHAAEKAAATRYRALAGQTRRAVGRITAPARATLLLAGAAALLVAITVRRRLR
jgi:hypothetical protein